MLSIPSPHTTAHTGRGAHVSALVRTRESALPFALLPTTVDSSPNTNITITHYSDITTWTGWFTSVQESDVIALDIETKGTNPTDPESEIVGIGFSHGRNSLYIDVADISHIAIKNLVRYIEKLPAVIAHNIYFDAAFLRSHWDCNPHWVACTYGMYKQLATEGFPQQQWGLKSAQRELLGWEETNEVDLDRWLVDEGYIKSIKKADPETGGSPGDGYYKYHNDEGEIRYARPDKSEMWRAPTDILGYYCALDCDSTHQLYTRVLLPVAEQFPALMEYHERQYLTLLDVLIEQRLYGIRVNVNRLRSHADSLRNRMAEIREELRVHPVAGPHIEMWEGEKYREFLDKEPRKYRKGKVLGKEPPRWKKMKSPGKEPPQYRKDGAVSKNWLGWRERADRYEACGGRLERLDWIAWCERRDSGEYGRLELSKNWENWDERRRQILAGELPRYQFNVNSGVQLQWLLYEQLLEWRHARPGESIEVVNPDTGRTAELDLTDSGALPTDAKALQQMGEVGEILIRYGDAAKELSYVESYVKLSEDEDEDGYAILRPSFRVPGTLTGRLSGKDPNIQQIPKSREVLESFVSTPGTVFVQCDHTALENVVLAELSGDSKLMELYGPGAAPHDSYLFNASEMYRTSGIKIFKEVGEQYSADRETVSRLKKKYKNVRAISKKTTLSKNYGIGVTKLYKDLILQGADVTREEVEAIHRAYDEVYSGVSEWDAELQEEWRVRGGWVLNGIGRPLGVWERVRKDLVNRVCQSTGHDIHMEYVRIVRDLLDAEGIQWWPIIADFHDEMIIEVVEEQAERALYLMETEAYEILNREYLRGTIPLSGGGMITTSLADIKLED